MTKNNSQNDSHEYPEDCPFRQDHDTIITMAGQIKSIHTAMYGEGNTIGVLGHMEKLNGRTRKNEINIARVMAAAAAISVLIPILIKVLWS